MAATAASRLALAYPSPRPATALSISTTLASPCETA